MDSTVDAPAPAPGSRDRHRAAATVVVLGLVLSSALVVLVTGPGGLGLRGGWAALAGGLGLTALVAGTVENARLRDRALRRARHLATLDDLSRRLTTTLDPTAVAKEILAAAQVLIPGVGADLWESVPGQDPF